MNGLQRIMSAVSGEKPDRIPLSLTLSLYGAKLTNCPLKEYYTNPDYYVAGQQKVFEAIAPDIIFSPFTLPKFGEAFGSEIKYFDNQPPNLKKPVIKNIEDIHNLDFPKALESDVIRYFSESIKGLKENLGHEVAIAAIAPSPFELPVMLMGIGNWLDLLLSYPKESESLIGKSSEFFLNITNQFFENGATFIVLPTIFFNPTIITKGIAKKLIHNSQNIFSQLRGPVVLHSGGARMTPFLEIYENLANVVGFVINSDDSLIDARKNTTQDQVIVGNIEGPTLANLSKEEIATQTLEICNKFSTDSNFIFGSSGADISYNTPLDNILIIKKVLEQLSEDKS